MSNIIQYSCSELLIVVSLVLVGEIAENNLKYLEIQHLMMITIFMKKLQNLLQIIVHEYFSQKTNIQYTCMII